MATTERVKMTLQRCSLATLTLTTVQSVYGNRKLFQTSDIPSGRGSAKMWYFLSPHTMVNCSLNSLWYYTVTTNKSCKIFWIHLETKNQERHVNSFNTVEQGKSSGRATPATFFCRCVCFTLFYWPEGEEASENYTSIYMSLNIKRYIYVSHTTYNLLKKIKWHMIFLIRHIILFEIKQHIIVLYII